MEPLIDLRDEKDELYALRSAIEAWPEAMARYVCSLLLSPIHQALYLNAWEHERWSRLSSQALPKQGHADTM